MNIKIDEIKTLNPRHEPLTPEKLRELSGLDLSDQEAEDVIWSIRKFIRVLHGFAIQQRLATNFDEHKEQS